MKRTMKKTAEEMAKMADEFAAKVEAARAARPKMAPVKILDNFVGEGFCKHGIPLFAICPHGCGKK